MNTNNKVKKMTMNGILISLAAILHQITPALGLPMQPDFAIIMLFIIIILNRDYKTIILSSIIIGVLTGLTTKFPGGQIPNIIDKLVTGNIIYLSSKILNNIISEKIEILIYLVFGTIISGTTFLYSAMILVGLPSGATFMGLIISVLAPTLVLNMILGIILYKTITRALIISKVKIS
ncbi:tryptophan transporter [Clostridium sp.]|uniref:tryptophan transporter n=1 Tax=Clostridium sp. TaxID=1506 RepID=UPI00262079B2|nr:tryptophan transporter [Clostridium sp.]